MSHGTIEMSAPRDHTEDALLKAYWAARDLHAYATGNVEDAKLNLFLAKLAAERTQENERAARAALDAHRGHPPASNV